MCVHFSVLSRTVWRAFEREFFFLFSLFSRVLKSPKKRPKRKERHEYHVPRVIHTYTFARLERDRDREILPRNDDGDEFEVFVVWPASEERERDQ